MRFPVLLFFSKEGMYSVHNEKSLMTSNVRSVGYFEGLIIYDSDGFMYEVDHAKVKMKAPPFWGFSLFESRRILVDIKYKKEPISINMDEVKLKIKERINEQQAFWDSAGDVEDLYDRIDRSSTSKELIKLFL